MRRILLILAVLMLGSTGVSFAQMQSVELEKIVITPRSSDEVNKKAVQDYLYQRDYNKVKEQLAIKNAVQEMAMTDQDKASKEEVAQQAQYNNSPVNKGVRGIGNMATFWADIPETMNDVARRKGIIVGATGGFVKGLAVAFIRGFDGLYDTLTFALPPYDEAPSEPEYVCPVKDGKFTLARW